VKIFDINCIIAGKFVRCGKCAYCVLMRRSKPVRRELWQVNCHGSCYSETWITKITSSSSRKIFDFDEHTERIYDFNQLTNQPT